MNVPPRDNPLSDDDIVGIARGVEPHDFERIAPPPQVWNNILAELEAEAVSPDAPASQSHRRFSSTRILSIAAATIVMVGIAFALVTGGSDDTAVTEFAAAMMTDEGLQVATSETAAATVKCAGSTDEPQDCYIELDLTALPDAGDASLELWVINSDVSDMHTLGNITSDGRFELPPDVNPDDFPIVDISIEPDDGDETHSGQSVLRGVLAKP